MLAFATRIGCVAGLLCLAACDNSPASGPKQHTSSNTQSDEADGGKDRDDQDDAGDDHRISTGSAGKHADKPASDSSKAGGSGGSGGSGGHAAGKGGDADMKDEKGGAGGEEHANGDAGHGGEGATAADDMHAGAGGGDDGDSDKGSGGAAAPSGMPMGGAPSTQDSINILWQWLGQTPQGMAADVIRKYLDALGSGDAPASSIDDFLHAIDDQAHCTQGVSEQCLAACQVVARSCGVCLLDEDCRGELVKVCGVLTCR